jgi:hypothetical protein
MGGPAVAFRITPVRRGRAGEAHQFHMANAQNELVLLRSRESFQALAQDGSLYGAWDEEGPLVAIVYTERNSDWSWEVGGLTVARSLRGLGIATTLVRFAIASSIISANTSFAEPILAHVHQQNPLPKPLLPGMGFVMDGTYSLPLERASPNLPPAANGQIIADQYRFTQAGLGQLCAWFRAFNGTLEGGVRCRFEFSANLTLREFTSALCDISANAQRSRD